MRDDDKIQRQVHFIWAQPFDAEDSSGDNNTWNYNRAPDGYKFELVSIDISGHQESSMKYGHVALFDGHEYTHWNLWPGVESRELLWRSELNDYVRNGFGNLNNWECKEYTLGIRSTHATFGFKTCIVIWYYLRKMSWLEKLYYAVIQPKGDRYKKTLGITAEVEEIPH